MSRRKEKIKAKKSEMRNKTKRKEVKEEGEERGRRGST